MTLPSSGTLSLNDIATEFSDTQPNSMNEFYKDGSLVPSQKIIPASGSDITAFSGTNAPKFQGGTLPNNTQVYEGIENTKSPGTITSSLADQRTGLTYTTPYAGTLYVLVVGGGAAGSWWGGGIGYAGSGGAALLVSKSVASGENYSVTVGGGGAGHGPANGHGQGGSASSVTGPGSFSVTATGGSHTSPYGSGNAGGTATISGTGVTTISSSSGTVGASGNGQTGGASGIISLTNVTVSPINGGDTQIWAQSTRNSPLNSSTNYWEPGSFNTTTGVWTFSSTTIMGGWGQGGYGLFGYFNGGHGAGGLVIMWMNPQQYQAININVPTSGEISIADFYDAEDA
jgi:hypothetical protein